MIVDAYASERQYAQHIFPIWAALDEHERGTFHLHYSIPEREAYRHVGPVAGGIPDGRSPVLVASIQDHRRIRWRSPCPTIFVEHGAGQRYVEEGAGHPAYSGGSGRDGVGLFICPNRDVAARNQRRYDADAVAVGCPKLDYWHGGPPRRPRGSRTPVVAVSFHANVTLCPETMWALPHFAVGLPRLAREHVVLGHAHPRAWGALKAVYDDVGIEATADFDDVLERADVYVCDNSSTIPEAMSVGIPVVFLNPPWYRRHVEHGGRFWRWVEGGVECSDPSDLLDAVGAQLHVDLLRAERAEVVGEVYESCDGKAALRAVDAIRSCEALTRRLPVSNSNPYADPQSPIELRGGLPRIEPRIDGPPNGTVQAVLAWVGNNRARAAAAIDAEQRRDPPRASLLDRLERIAR